MQQKSLEMTVLATPDMANFSGHVHGGHIMKLLDQVAYSCASRYSEKYVVTAASDHIQFRAPVFVGELVTFLACVNYVGRTSMEIGIKVVAENVRTRERRHVNTSYFTMVAVDEQGSPVPAPPLELTTEIEHHRHNLAELRRNLNKSYRDEHEKLHTHLSEFEDLGEKRL